MIYLIVGRTGSGKDYLANRLAEKGFPLLKSYTTRPRRTSNEDSHIFITPEKAAEIKDKVATTTINGYEYFATAEQVNSSKIYIIDPNGLRKLIANMPDADFCIINVDCDNDERARRAVYRVNKEDRAKEEAVFKNRNASEKAQFDAFDDDIVAYRNGIEIFGTNVLLIINYDNKFDKEATDDFVEFIVNYDKQHELLKSLVEDAMSLPQYAQSNDVEHKGFIKLPTEHEDPIYVTYGQFVAYFMKNPDQFVEFATDYMATSPRFADLR